MLDEDWDAVKCKECGEWCDVDDVDDDGVCWWCDNEEDEWDD